MDSDKIVEEAQKRITQAQLNADSEKLVSAQQDVIMQEQEKGIASEQLDLGELLNNMYNLLRGYILVKHGGGTQTWEKPDDNDLIILTDYGVNYFMKILQAYLTKNTLLSNYDDDQIREKMEDIATTIADDVFMEYDKMFQFPTLADCKKEIEERIKAKVDIKIFASELIGLKADEKGIKDQVLKEMESRIERELEVIKEQKKKNKLKRFESLIRIVQDTIHSAYQRAWKGQERTSIRQHHHISENKGVFGGTPPQQNNNGFNPFEVLKRR